MSKYRLSITRVDDKPVSLIAGGKGERDLIQSVLAKITRVGIFRTQAQVLTVVEQAMNDVIHEAKSEVLP